MACAGPGREDCGGRIGGETQGAMNRTACLCALTLWVFGVAGCEKFLSTESKPDRASAEKKAAAGEFEAAVNLYEAQLDGTPKSAEIHFRLAVLYDEKLKNQVAALHHFGRYLELQPKGPHAKAAKDYKSEGQLKLVTSLSNGTFVSQTEAARIKNENLSLRKTVNELQAQKAARLAATPVPGDKAGAAMKKSAEPTRRPIPLGVRTHVVASGETLASIAQKYYKNKARWKEIQDANFFPSDGTAKIKPGDELAIP
jgi:nucleoid-associated protein YgaU